LSAAKAAAKAGATKLARDTDPSPPLDELGPTGLDQHVGFMLRVATAAVMRDLARELESFELRPRQYACLLVLRAEPGLQQQRVGDILSVKHSNLIATIDELESRGLVVRTRLPHDRRANVLQLTTAGTKLLKQIHSVEIAHRSRLSHALGKNGVTRLLDSLNRLARLT